jgi:hypothetical protein
MNVKNALLVAAFGGACLVTSASAFPIANEGTAARNEVAVLRSALRFAEEQAESVRLRLGS